MKNKHLKYFFYIVISYMILTILTSYSQSDLDFLKTDGIYIKKKSGRGDIIRFCGVNLGGWLLHESWMSPLSGADNEFEARNILDKRFGEIRRWKLYNTYWDSFIKEDDFKSIAGEGLNCVRLVIYYNNHMDKNGNWYILSNSKIDFTRIDWAVNTAQKYGLYTIIDLHGAPGSQNGEDHSGREEGALLYKNPEYQKMLIDFWENLAAHFKNNPFVAGYDILNEPSVDFPSSSSKEVWDLFDKIYKTIRMVDPDHMIFMNFCWSWTNAPDPKVYGWQNVVYEFHHYLLDNHDDFNNMKKFIDNNINESWTCRKKYNVPYLIGETTFYNNKKSWEYGLTQFNKNEISWIIWTYKVKDYNSSWGLYTCKYNNTYVPDLKNDSYDIIINKWGRWDTKTYFKRNDKICNIIKAQLDKKQ